MQTEPIPVPTPVSAAAPDTELAARAAGGDASAFAVIMRRHNQLLFRTARSILKSDDETEDALQEAYLQAWRAIGGFRADARLSTWLVRIVINQALGRLRRRGAQVIPLDTAIIGISSIHLLKTFINAEAYSDKALIAQTVIHITFLLSAMAIAYTDRLMSAPAHRNTEEL